CTPPVPSRPTSTTSRGSLRWTRCASGTTPACRCADRRASAASANITAWYGREVTSVGEVVAFLERRYPPGWAESWDRVGLVLGEPAAPVRTALLVVDCVPETVDEAVALGADLIVAHHPLLLRGVSSVAPTTYKGRLVHRLIKADIALYTAHTNADVAAPGVSGALAARLGLSSVRPLVPAVDDASRGTGRIGVLPSPVALAELAAELTAGLGLRAVVSDVDTDPWTLHYPTNDQKEPSP